MTETVNFPTIQKEKNIYTDSELELFRNSVKKHIMNYGSLFAINNPSNPETFNSNTNSAYSPNSSFSEGYVKHAVSIVGWDDNYSRNNFNECNRPSKDGAYIVLNSWGEEFGNNGYYYVSYEDYNIESDLSGIKTCKNVNESKKYFFSDATSTNTLMNLERKNYIFWKCI